MKRRSLLKMLGVGPALLVPWKPVTERVAPPSPAPVEPRKLSLDEALSMVDWEALELPPAPETAIARARTYAATGTMGFDFSFRPGGDDGAV